MAGWSPPLPAAACALVGSHARVMLWHVLLNGPTPRPVALRRRFWFMNLHHASGRRLGAALLATAALLAAAGRGGGLTLDVPFHAYDGYVAPLARVLQQWLAEVGVRVELLGLEQGAVIAGRRAGEFATDPAERAAILERERFSDLSRCLPCR